MGERKLGKERFGFRRRRDGKNLRRRRIVWTRWSEVALARLRRSLVRRRDLLREREEFEEILGRIDPSRVLKVFEGKRTRRRKTERSSGRRRMRRKEEVGRLVGEGRRRDRS